MDFSTFKTRLALNCGNLQNSHPFFSYVDESVNEAVRFTVLRASQRFPNFQLFPEHKDIEWTDVTIADQNYLALPNDHIAIQRVFSSDSSSAPTLANTAWREVSYIDPKSFDLLTKPTTQTGYPTNYTLREGRVYFWPTPRTSWTTYVKIDGIQDEPTMSGNSDTPRTHERWHPAILDFASYLLLTQMGWDDDAKRFLEAGDEKIGAIGASMVGLRRAGLNSTIRVAGMPR